MRIRSTTHRVATATFAEEIAVAVVVHAPAGSAHTPFLRILHVRSTIVRVQCARAVLAVVHGVLASFTVISECVPPPVIQLTLSAIIAGFTVIVARVMPLGIVVAVAQIDDEDQGSSQRELLQPTRIFDVSKHIRPTDRKL
jgi:hypothetical protein